MTRRICGPARGDEPSCETGEESPASGRSRFGHSANPRDREGAGAVAEKSWVTVLGFLVSPTRKVEIGGKYISARIKGNSVSAEVRGTRIEEQIIVMNPRVYISRRQPINRPKERGNTTNCRHQVGIVPLGSSRNCAATNIRKKVVVWRNLQKHVVCEIKRVGGERHGRYDQSEKKAGDSGFHVSVLPSDKDSAWRGYS
jgi:hypothetical protein